MLINKLENLFSYKDYKGKHFTSELKAGDTFYYHTYDIVTNKEYTFKMIKTNNRYKGCYKCPLVKYYCGGVECNCIIKKVL